MVGERPDGPSDPTQLSGRTAPWGPAGVVAIALLVVVAIWLRLPGLGADGFADDEVHKWLAANRYLTGNFGGDDVEHPMLMKSLIAIAIAAFGHRLSPEVLTRLPNVLAGALTVWATAQLGRRLFGRPAALVGAGLLAVATTVVGYHRVAKEDVLLGLFITLSFWCLAEARAAAQDGRIHDGARWELWSAAALGAAFASKYFLFYCLTPVLAYLWLRPVSTWRVPLRRWLVLVGVAFAVFVLLNWAPFVPGTFDYLIRDIRGELGGDRGVSESILFMGHLRGNMGFQGDAAPIWFFGAIAVLKFLPATAVLTVAGFAIALWRRAPAHRLLLSWLAIFHLFFLVAGAKYGRFFISIAPACLLLAGHAAVLLAGAITRWLARSVEQQRSLRLVAISVLALLLVGPEARAAVAHAPHHRLYVSPLAGGDRSVDWFLPHCDYWDAGVREALSWIDQRAERGAEVCTEVDWTVRFYGERDGRTDLIPRPLLPGRCCDRDRPCYVVLQPGRLYRHNEAAVANLSRRPPDHVERVGGHVAVRVYRLPPGESPFPAAPVTSVSAP